MEIQENHQLHTKITSANSVEEIRAALMAEAQRQGIVAVQGGSYVLAPEKVKHTRVEKIGGRDVTFTADTALELEQQIGAALKAAQTTHANEQTTDSTFAKAELELKFKRGEINTQEYLEQSGEIARFLEERGVDVNGLESNRIIENDWAEATQKFLESDGGRDWPGGPQNLEIMGRRLVAMGLTNATDKVAAFEKAWNDMKATNSYVPHVEAATEVTPPSSWATPEEILAAWKVGVAGQGRDLGEAFNSTFSRPKDRSSSTVFGGR